MTCPNLGGGGFFVGVRVGVRVGVESELESEEEKTTVRTGRLSASGDALLATEMPPLGALKSMP